MALRDVSAVVTITTNATKAIDDGKKLKEVYAAINQQLNLMRSEGKVDTQEFKDMQKLADDTLAKIKTLVSGMRLINGVVDNLSNKTGKDLNRALRETSKEFNKTAADTEKGREKLERLREAVASIKREVSDRKGLTMSFIEAQKQLSNLAGTRLDKLRAGLASVRAELEGDINSSTRARLQDMENRYKAQIAIRETGTIPTSTLSGVTGKDRVRLEAERERLVNAYNAVSLSSDKTHAQWADLALQRIQNLNSALKELTETERREAQEAKEQAAAMDKLRQTADVMTRLYHNEKVSIQELAAAQKDLEERLKAAESVNPDPISEQQTERLKQRLETINQAFQDISRADIDKVLSDIDSQSLETLEATLKKLKEEAATFKIGDDREIKDAVSDMTALEQAISRFKDKLAGIDQLDFDHLENVPTEKLEAALKRIEEQEKSLKGTDEKLAQQMAENKTKVVNQLNRNRQATIDYANAEKVAAERGKHSVTEMQAAYDALQQKLLSLRAEEHDAIRQTRQQMRMLKSDINEVKGEVTGLTKLWKTAVRNIATYVGVFAGFNMVKSKIMEIAKDSLALSDSMAQVQKVTGLAAKEIDTLNYSLAKLDTRTTLTQLNDLAFSAGKMGLGKYGLEGVEGFVRATNQLQVALGDDLGNSVDEAITPLAKLAENLGLIQKMGVEKSMMAIGSSINELSQTTTAVGANIVDFARRIQPAAQMIGLTTDEILALGSASDSFGIASEVSATAFTKFLAAYRTNTAEIERILGMTKGTLDQYFDQGRTIEGLMAIFQRMHDIGDLRYLEEAFKALGSEGSRMFTTFGAFSKNIDMFREHLATSTKAFQEATSVTREFNLVQETAQGLMERSSNIWKNAFVNPEGVDAMKQFAQAWYDVSRAMTGNKAIMAEIKFLLAGIVELVKILTYLLPSLLGGLTVLAAGRGLVGMRNALELTKLSAAGLTLSLNGLKTAWTALSAVGKANWIGLIATAVFAAIEAFGMFNKKVQEAGIYLKDFKRDLGDLNVEYGKGEAELRRYRRAIDEANAGSKQRAAAIAQFNSKFKPYLSNLLTEKSTALDVAKAYQEVCKQMRAKIAMQLKEKDISEQVAPREQWTAQRREEYDRQAREAGMGQYGADWITGFAQDNQNKSIDTLVRTIGKQYYNLPQQIVDEVAKQAAAGNRQFNNYGNIINSKYLGQANALLAAGSYIRQDRSTMNTMQQVNKKWAPEEKRISDYLASQEQETSSFNPDDLPPSKEELKAAKKAEAEHKQAIRKDLQDAKQESDAIIAKIEEWYRLQETVVTGFAADGKWTQQQAEMVNRELEAAKNEALANARLAISGRDTQTWEQTKESLRVMMFDTGQWSQELFQQMMDVSMASIRQNLSRIDKEGGQYGITTSSLKDGLDKNAAGNRRKVQELRNKTAKEVEKALLQYDYFEQAARAYEDRLTQLGLLTETAEQAADRIRKASGSLKAGNKTEEQMTAERSAARRQAGQQFIKNPGKSYAVDYTDTASLNSWLQDFSGAKGTIGASGMEFQFSGWAEAFKDEFNLWLKDSEKYKADIQGFYLSLVDFDTAYYDAVKKNYDEQKKQFDSRWNASGMGQAYETMQSGLDRMGREQKMTGADRGTNFAQQAGFAALGTDPEIAASQLRMEQMQKELDKFIEVNEKKKLEGAALEAYNQQLAERQRAADEAQLAMAETVMAKINDRIAKLQEWTAPIEQFGADVGDAMGKAVFESENMVDGMKSALKNLAQAWGEHTIQIIKELMMQQLKQKMINKAMKKEQTSSEKSMTNVTEEGEMSRENLVESIGSNMVKATAQFGQQKLATKQQQDTQETTQTAHKTIFDVLAGIAGGSAKTIESLGWWGIPLVAVITALLMGLLNTALSALGGGGSNEQKAATKPKIKLASGMLTYDKGNVQQTVGSQWRGKNGEYITDERRTVVGDDGRVYRAREQRSLPEGVSMVTEPIATRVNGQQALVGERGPEIVIGRRTTRAIQMNRPDLLRDLALIDRGITTRKVRTFDEGNISDMATAFAGQLPAPQPSADGQQGSGDAQRERDQAMLATLGVLSQTIGQLQQQLAAGIHAEMNMFGDNGAYKKFQQADKFYKKYGG